MTADIGLDVGASSEAMFETGRASLGDSFSFGVEREMKESGEKGGTEDINIGVGELQECTVSKSMDMASGKLAQVAINGSSTDQAATDRSSDFFVADSFSFGVEREMKESGEKGGTEDINIGVGELQECTVSKSMDRASGKLAQFAINGNSPGTAEIEFVEVGGGGDTDAPGGDMSWDNVKNVKWNDDGVVLFAADSFSFGVEREMKESGEKGGTEDMNIGIGELQEAADAEAVDVAMKSWSTSGDADDRPTEEVAFYYNDIPG